MSLSSIIINNNKFSITNFKFILFFLIIPTKPQINGDDSPSNKKYFALDVVKMDDYLRQTAVITLLKLRADALLRRNMTTFRDAIIYRACCADAHNVVDLAKCLVALRNNIAATTKASDLSESREDLSLWMQAKRLFTEFVPSLDVDGRTKLSLDVGQFRENDRISDENHHSSIFDDKNRLPYSRTISEVYNEQMSLKPVALPSILQNAPDDIITPTFHHRVTPSDWRVKSPSIRQDKFNLVPSGGPIAARQFSRELYGEGDEEAPAPERNTDYRRHRRKRKRRSIENDDRIEEDKGVYQIDERYRNVHNLERLNRYMEMRNFCGKFIQRMNAENARFLAKALPRELRHVDYRTIDNNSQASGAIDEIVNAIQQFVTQKSGKWSKISILSPKFFSLFRRRNHEAHETILSPSLLAFYDDEDYADEANGRTRTRPSVLSIPKLLSLFNGKNEVQRSAWLDVALELSGAAASINRTLHNLRSHMDYVEHQLFPAILELERRERNWNRLHASFDKRQKRSLGENGFAFLSAEQMRLIYDAETLRNMDSNALDWEQMSDEQREYQLDRRIDELAKLRWTHTFPSTNDRDSQTANRRKRKRKRRSNSSELNRSSPCFDRIAEIPYDYSSPNFSINYHGGRDSIVELDQMVEHPAKFNGSTALRYNTSSALAEPQPKQHNEIDDNVKSGSREEGIEIRTLKPFAFGSNVGHGVALEALTLSPYAFFGEIAAPEALISQVLTPRAFVATVLSPGALLARILSPAAFRAEILSPRALSTYVLSPEALVGDVLSPKALEPHVLSPEFLVAKVLSPEALSPKVLSPEIAGAVILSPTILSPRVFSGETMMVEVISPNILGGSMEGESGEKNSKEGETALHVKERGEKEAHVVSPHSPHSPSIPHF